MKQNLSPLMTELFEAYSTEPDKRFESLLLAMGGIQCEIEANGGRIPHGGDYAALFEAVVAALRKKATYVMPPQQVTLTAATIEAIVERVAERKAPANPKIAYISVDGAQSVADHLERAIVTTCPVHLVQQWQEVSDALQAIANDTAQIRTRA